LLGGGFATAWLWRGGLLLPAGCVDRREDGGIDTDGASPIPAPATPVAVQKGPWITVTGPGSARLRFETAEDVRIPVRFLLPDGTATWHEPTRTTITLQYQRDTSRINEGRDPADAFPPDFAGPATLHDVEITDLPTTGDLAWEVHVGGDVLMTGTHRAPQGANLTRRLAWMSDTMTPVEKRLHGVLAGLTPDVLLHGGDCTYADAVTDTWNGLFAAARPLLSIAALHGALGNHDGDMPYEQADMWERLFGGQGDARGTHEHAFSLGSARVIVLDSESEGLTSARQQDFLMAELDRVEQDASLQRAVVGFHRPLLTLSKYWDDRENERDFDTMHEIFRSRGVSLVLAGHAHSFEHFDVDGVNYVVDGCGGALLYDPDEEYDRANASRPDLVAARKIASRTYGGLVIDAMPDGALQLRRIQTEDGSTLMTLDLPA
jgi:predicted phosphodiesterase